MSNCSKCEAELPEGARFCNKCGSPQFAASATKEGSPKTTPAGIPIVTPIRTIEPGAKHRPQQRSVSDNSKNVTPPVLKSKIWPNEAKPAMSSDQPESPAQPDTSEPASTSTKPTTPPDKQEQKRPEAIVITPTQVAQEASGRKAAPGLIRPIGTAVSRKLPTNPKTPIPRRPGQPTQPPVTPAPQAQGFIKQVHTPPPSSFSQNGRQMADQVTQQELAQYTPQIPLREQVISNLTSSGRLYTPIENMPTGRLPGGVVQARSDMAHPPTLPERSQENLDATRRAAEHWRNSWRDRQRAEAGPIIDVSRGDASVPMPLMSMQNSLVRLRAIVTANKRNQQARGSNLTFWITIIVMICLIGGLGAYVISTYLPNSPFSAAHIAPPQSTAQPALTIQGTQLTTIAPGQTVHLHGEHFGANDSITFLLDTVTPITDAKGKPLTAQTSSNGAFDVSLLVGKDWLAGTRLISAQDSRTGLSAYLYIQVGVPGKPMTTSNKLALSVSELKFKAVIGQAYPGQQRVTLTNTSGAVLQWAATAIVENNLSWLVIDDNQTSGSLNISGTDSIGISVLPTGLQSSTTPYKGQIVFTINGKEQLTLPVELQVVNAQAEIIFSPNPLTGIVNTANGTCKPGTTLTLINLGSVVIVWTLKSDPSVQSHISFLLDGKSAPSGQLQPSGSAGDTQVLTLQCNNVHAGDTYQSTLYANSLQWPVVVLIQTST